MRTLKAISAITLATALGVSLYACSEDEGLSDAPVGVVDDSATFVMTNSDQFPNLAVRCYEGALIITTTRDYGDAVNIVPDFPACADGDPVPASRK